LIEPLIRKNATDRRAIFSAGIPAWRRIQAPSASPPMPLAGTSDPTPVSDSEICQLIFQGMRGQKIGRNMST
jgi:hypothetical protein